MEKRYFLVDINDPSVRREISYDDYEYLMWIKEREEERRNRGKLRKLPFVEKLVSFVFLAFLTLATLLSAFHNDDPHVSNSLWVQEMTEQTELIRAEYLFLDGRQINGLYASYSDSIIVERLAEDTTYIHELAHAADDLNYFSWEQDLKDVLLEAYDSPKGGGALFEDLSRGSIAVELFAEALLYIETGEAGNYFSSGDEQLYTQTTKDFVEANNIVLEQLEEPVDYLTPDRVVLESVRETSDVGRIIGH